MAVTEQSFTGNGSTTNYSFTFPYLKTTDISVQVDAATVTNWSLANATTVQFNSAPSNGAKIKILRNTNVDNLTATFYAGSAIKSEDLNDNYTQNLYKTQEVGNRYFANTGGTMTGDLTLDTGADLIFEGSTEDTAETRLTVADPSTDRTITLPNETGTVVTTGSSGVVTSTMINDGTIATGDIANDAITNAKIADDSIDSEHYVDGSIDTAHIADAQITTAKLATDSVTSAKIAAAQVDTSELATNAVTTVKITDANVTTAKIAADAITGAKIADDAIDSEHYTDGSVDTAHIATDAITGAKIADDSIDSEHYVDGSIDTAHIADSQVTTAKIAADAITGAKIADDAVDSEHYTDASIDTAHITDANITAAKLASNSVETSKITDANVTTAKIADDAITIGKIGCEQTTISDSDSHIPTSGAVVDYVAAQIAPIGGLEVIADDESFPETQPAAGVVISIADAGGLVVNGSGVSTTGDTITSNATVTINGINSAFNSSTVDAGVSFMVSSTGSGQIYNFHKATLKEADILSLSNDINDFAARYRVNAGEPSSSLNEGDLVYDTNADKMKVYDSSTSAWKEVTSTGDFKYLFLCPAGGSGAPTLDGSIATYDLRESSNSGSAASVSSAAQLLVSINGVVQKANTGTSAPAEGFALVDANTIVFGANLASGDSVFITQAGSAVSIPTPGDGTVSAAKIASGAVETAKIADSAVTTAKLGADSVTAAKIGDDVINSEHIAAGAVDLEHMSSQSVDEDNLYIDNAGSNGQVLTKQSGGTGGLLWADAAGGGAVGGGSDKVFMENGQTVTTNYTIGTEFGAACNALSAGPITINNGITVTIDSGDNWTIV